METSSGYGCLTVVPTFEKWGDGGFLEQATMLG